MYLNRTETYAIDFNKPNFYAHWILKLIYNFKLRIMTFLCH